MPVNIENMLFSLLRSQICTTKANDSLPSSVTEEELSALYTLAHRHDLAHIIAQALSRHHLLGHGGTDDDFRQALAEAAYRNEQFQYEFSEICRALTDDAIPHLPLKGAAIRTLYPAPWMRTSCDIDILVHESDLDRAAEALTEALGCRASEKRNYHDIALFCPGGIPIELHFSIRENMPAPDRLLSRVWEFSFPSSEGKMTYQQSETYLLFHIIAHMAYHFQYGGCGIRPLMDLYLLESKTSPDRALLHSMLEESGLQRFYSCVRALIGVWFGTDPHTDLTKNMQKFILSGGAYGTRSNFETVRQQRAGGSTQYIFQRIFMPYDDLKQKYPVLEKHRFLTPMYQAVRWCGLLRGKKLSRSIQTLRRIRNLDADKIETVHNLLKEVGL